MPANLIVKQLTVKTDQNRPQQCLNSTQLFACFASQPWAMLLDSANCDHVDSRFDIMVAKPRVKIICQHQQTQIIENQQSSYSLSDPLLIVQQQIDRVIKIKTNPTHLPFIGGAVGYFGYDLGASFEVLDKNALDDINTPDMAVGIFDWAIIKDNHQQTLWFVSQGPSLQSVAPEFVAYCQTRHINPTPPFAITCDWQANMDFNAYTTKFNQVQQYLLSGDCYQINLAQRFTAHFKGDEYNAYCLLRETNKAPFSAFLRFEDYAVVSISPERLLQLNGSHIQTKPIKGTAVRSTDPEQDAKNAQQLSQSPKDRAENVMIVDLLRNDIGKVSVAGSVKVPSLFAIESFPAVHHLVSTVTGELDKQYRACDLLRSAFPGGSITGAPKIRAMQIIDQLEPHRRSVYCGSIGYICASGNMDTSITIRTLVCQRDETGNKIHCWAGGALVADSLVDSEYQETYDKVNKILPVLSVTYSESGVDSIHE
ncbi:MAG: para-aminobenzoate synthetase component 1 [Alteromonadaceae bacterium]|jgi:para-aminobenzoate synthetase component 1